MLIRYGFHGYENPEDDNGIVIFSEDRLVLKEVVAQFPSADYLALHKADLRQFRSIAEVFAMTGASFTHNLIVGNLLGELRQNLRDGPCFVLPSDMRVRIEAADASKYPDVVSGSRWPSLRKLVPRHEAAERIGEWSHAGGLRIACPPFRPKRFSCF